MVALPCGSRSTSSTRLPACARPAARFTRGRGLADAALLVGDREDARHARSMRTRCRSASRPGTRSRTTSLHAEARGQPLDLLERMHALHRGEHAAAARAAGRRANELAELGEGARHDGVEARLRSATTRSARSRPRTFASCSSATAWVRNAAFLWLLSSSVTCSAGPAIAIGMPGQSGAAADVEHARAAHVRQHRERVEQMMRDHAAAARGWRSGCRRGSTSRADRGTRSSVATCAAASASAERGGRAPELLRAAHAALFCGRSFARAARRFRCTSSREIAAGVTPWMRDAWPIVSGRWCASFCRTSIDRPRTAP